MDSPCLGVQVAVTARTVRVCFSFYEPGSSTRRQGRVAVARKHICRQPLRGLRQSQARSLKLRATFTTPRCRSSGMRIVRRVSVSAQYESRPVFSRVCGNGRLQQQIPVQGPAARRSRARGRPPGTRSLADNLRWGAETRDMAAATRVRVEINGFACSRTLIEPVLVHIFQGKEKPCP